MSTNRTAEPTVTHSTFTVERDYPVPPARVFAAFADAERKRAWFGSPEETDVTHELDFRDGGREVMAGTHEGQEYRFVAHYGEITDNERLVYSYDMHYGGQYLSTSVSSIELEATDGGTHLRYVETGAFVAGRDDVASRQAGTEELLDSLGRALQA